MRKKNLAKKQLLWLMITALAAGNVMPAAAAVTEKQMESTITKDKPEKKEKRVKKATPSEAEKPETEEEEDWKPEADKQDKDEQDQTENSKPSKVPSKTEDKATSSVAVKPEKEFSMKDMPKIGTSAFTKWFFENTDQSELWDFVIELLANEDADDYQAFMKWVEKNEVRFSKAFSEYTGTEPMLLSAVTGDLWNEWTGAKMSWDGAGSKVNPYKITSLSELMGLSEAVAQGESFSGKYFELQADIDLGNLNLNDGAWNPIGWFKNVTDLNGKPKTAFEGTFDGAGNTISGLRFTKIDQKYSYLGLFGYLKNATVKNLTLEADEVSGEDNVGLLAGCIEGNSTIYNVAVSGALYGNGDAGAIAGEVTGGSKQAVIENCTADNVIINSEGKNDFVGGIAGNAQKTDIVDCKVSTQDGDSNRIQGKGYVGGIAGRQNKVNIYNSYVTGTIGGNLTTAVGGITGLYESGNIIVAQMDGEISKTNNGTASHEGAIIGTREPRNGFRYGTGKNDNFSYLFVSEDQKVQTKNISGSGIPDDNTFTLDAHIGYYTDFQKKYTQVAGTVEKKSGERYYYEELEDGIKYIITQKLGKDLTIDYAKGEAFKIDHYAPGNQGEPVLGYLVSIPRIDTKNANGTYDNDVATLTAISDTNNSYYRQIDKDNPSAVAPGCTITVATAAKNKDGNRYQMVFDENADGKVKPPTYTDEAGDKQDMTYVNGGSYSFVMPESDTELNVDYVKVTTELAMTPGETDINVTQTRTGDRKNPQIKTEVRNDKGTLIARYINGRLDTSVQVLPISIHAEHNGEGSTSNRTVTWAIDDTNLLHFEEGWTDEYSTKDAKIVPNIESDFIQNIINREVKAQADGNYQEAIKNTIYTDSAVVTASTNPATSVDNKAVTGTCKVNVNFQIVDQTTLRVEGLNLNQTSATITVTRKLTGDRVNPTETITSDEATVLAASLYPEQPFNKNVTWKWDDSFITTENTGDHKENLAVSVRFDADGKANPAWIQNVINADNQKRKEDKYAKISGNSTMTTKVMATADDQTHGNVTSTCNITINFVTVDETVVHPETVEMSKSEVKYDLSVTKEGDINSKEIANQGFDATDLDATVNPVLADDDTHKPYDNTVTWSVSDADALTVDQNGNITPNKDAQWIKEAQKLAPYKATKTVEVYAMANDKTNNAVGKTVVTLNYETNVVELPADTLTYDITLTKTGRRSNPNYTWAGGDVKTFKAATYPAEDKNVKYTSSNDSIFTVKEDGSIYPVLSTDLQWVKDVLAKYPYTGTQTVTISATDGTSTDTAIITLNLKVVDNTYSGGSSGGGGGAVGGGGGSSSSGVRPGGVTTSTVTGLPSYVLKGGTWTQNAAGKWFYSNGRTFTNEWAAVQNPYADTKKGQPAFDWFHFGADSAMTTGWFTDEKGDTYYLHTVSDNTLGHMYTGWNWIDSDGDGKLECFYFNTVSDGTRGRLFKNTTTPDNYTVNEKGQWTENGVVQTKTQEQLNQEKANSNSSEQPKTEETKSSADGIVYPKRISR